MPRFNLPYRRSVITDEISQDIDRVIAMAREFDLDGLEIRSVWGKTVQELDDDELTRLKRAAHAANLTIVAVAPPFLKCAVDSIEDWQQHKRILERTLQAADWLGARIVRGFTFWRKGSYGEYWDRIVDAYREVLPTIEMSGHVVAIENEPTCMIGTSEPLIRLIRAIDSPYVRALWDPANGFFDGDPAYPDGFNAVSRGIVGNRLYCWV